MYISKKVYVVYNGVKAPRSWAVFKNFCVKSNLILAISYRKNWGAGCITCSPNNFFETAAAPRPMVPMPMIRN